MISLRAKLSFWLASSLIVLLVLQWSIASVVIQQLVEAQLVDRLSQDAESLLSGIDFTAQQPDMLDTARVSGVYQRPFSGHYYVIRTTMQAEYSRSLWDSRLHVPEVEPGDQTLLRVRGPEKQPLLVAAHGYRKQGQSVTVAVAEDLTAINAGVRQFRLIHGVISFVILLALLGLQYYIVTHALRPLHKIRTDMRRLESGEIERIDAQRAPLEITPLIAELNRLLSTMSRKTRRSREALGNLAHALKTQLALLGQVAAHPQLNASPDLQTALRDTGENMRRIVERELKRARLLGAALPGKRVDLQHEIAALVKTLQMMYADKQIVMDWQVADDACYDGDQEDMLELLGNLLDNACKWCRQEMRLTVEGGEDLRLMVEDDGPGCEPDELGELTRRGFRLDESKPGSGLGLAIVKDIVDSYGGTIAFLSSPDLHGLRVEVQLPHAPRTSRPMNKKMAP